MLYKRLLNPHIWESLSFNKLSRDARLLFIGLINSGDDEGYFRADSGSIKRALFGFDEVTRDEIIIWIKEIKEKTTGIHFFANSGEAFGHFINWDKWQKLRKDRFTASLHPKCNQCATNGIPSDNQVTTNGLPLSAEDKVREDKISKDNIPVNKSRDFSDKQKLYQELVIFLEEKLQTKFTNYPKQALALKKMFAAGYTTEQIKHVISKMCSDEFYRDKGFDMMTVANQIPLYKAKARSK